MPLISKLKCFGDPYYHATGEFDVMGTFTKNGVTHEQPKGCAGCPSRTACAQVVYRRLELCPLVGRARQEWESATQREEGDKRFLHPTFQKFKDACTAQNWLNSNDEALEKKRKADKKRTRRAAKAKAKRANTRTLQPEIETAIDKEYDDRLHRLINAAAAQRAEPWLRNLSQASITFTCDVWKAKEILRRTKSYKISGAEIARHLLSTPTYATKNPKSLPARVNEAIIRIDRLEYENFDEPIWKEFKPITPFKGT